MRPTDPLLRQDPVEAFKPASAEPPKVLVPDRTWIRQELLGSYLRAKLLKYLGGKFPGIRYHDREELVQDALLKAERNIVEFRWGGRKDLYKWLKVVARNVTLDWIRKQPAEKTVSLSAVLAIAAPEPPPDEQIEPTTTTRHLKRHLVAVRLFLEQLPVRERDAITLVDICEVPIRQAAERLGITYNALVQARHRAHDKLHVLVLTNPEILRPWLVSEMRSYLQKGDIAWKESTLPS